MFNALGDDYEFSHAEKALFSLHDDAHASGKQNRDFCVMGYMRFDFPIDFGLDHHGSRFKATKHGSPETRNFYDAANL
jgi:hypothetical protein